MRVSANNHVSKLGDAILNRLVADAIDAAHERLAAALGPIGQPATPALDAQIEPVRDIDDDRVITRSSSISRTGSICASSAGVAGWPIGPSAAARRSCAASIASATRRFSMASPSLLT